MDRRPVRYLASLLFAASLSQAEVESHPSISTPGPEEETRPCRVDIERHEDGVLIRFYGAEAGEACVEGSFTEWRRRPMRSEDGAWVFRKRLRNGDHRFRVLYRLEGGETWLAEPARQEEPAEEPTFYAIEIDDRGFSWSLEDVGANALDAGLGATYNRVEGLRLTGSLGFEKPLRESFRVGWSQSYSIAAERWSWEATASAPLRVVPGIRIEANGSNGIRVPTAWTVTPSENFAAAILLHEDFFDYVWSRGWGARLASELGDHFLSAGYAVLEDEPATKETDWSLFGRGKDFRENLFGPDADVEGTSRRIEGRYRYDTRDYGNEPTHGWLAELQGDYSGWELGGDRDFWRGIAEIRRYQKLSPKLHADLRVLGGRIRGNAPDQELFRIGGVGTLRAHRLKELAGTRVFLANLEYRAAVWRDLECVFFADVGDAWRGEERESFDLESDMGIGLQDEDGDIRVDFARRLDRGASDDLVVTMRLARTF
jgi:hypothetical protein